jgi:cytoskeletal protein RodZ
MFPGCFALDVTPFALLLSFPLTPLPSLGWRSDREVRGREDVDDSQHKTASSQRPAASSQQPAASSQQPAASSQQPAASSQQPAASSQQPAASSQQPADNQDLVAAVPKAVLVLLSL